MKRFLKITVLFLLPFVLFYGLLAMVLQSSGETVALDQVVEATVDGSLVLYGSGYHENFQAYKYRVASRLGAQLLVMGTSRSMQFRSGFFKTDRFYNIGGGVKNAAEYLRFLQAMPVESLPKTVLVVLDQNMFNETWATGNPTSGLALTDLPVKKDILLRLGNSYGDGRFSILKNLKARPGVYGMAAATRGSGFASDGSYRYGTAALENLTQPESNFATTYRQIDFSQLRFAWGDVPRSQELEEIDRLLSFCAENGIQAVGMLPPFAPTVWERMMATGNYGYLEQLPAALQQVFAGYGFDCCDYSYLPDSTAVQYIDGFHGGDEIYAGIALDLAARSEVLAPLIDTDAIRALLAQPHDNPRVLPG